MWSDKSKLLNFLTRLVWFRWPETIQASWCRMARSTLIMLTATAMFVSMWNQGTQERTGTFMDKDMRTEIHCSAAKATATVVRTWVAAAAVRVMGPPWAWASGWASEGTMHATTHVRRFWLHSPIAIWTGCPFVVIQLHFVYIFLFSLCFCSIFLLLVSCLISVSYTHLTLPTIYSV